MSTKNIKNSDGLASLGLAVKKFALPALVSAVVALVAGGVYAVNATPANITVCAAKNLVRCVTRRLVLVSVLKRQN